jgi:hypothetical protein
LLSKCANPDCVATFRYLQQGKLFRLEKERTKDFSQSPEPEYFWLCGNCSETISLRLNQDCKVVMVAMIAKEAPGSSHFVALDRRDGLLLSCFKSEVQAEIVTPAAARRRAAAAR